MTISQQFTDKIILYKEYDFQKRKKRRGDESLNKQVAGKNLLAIREIFNRNNLKFFLLYGTVLGAIREKDFIAHDTDTDIGIFEKDREKFLSIVPDILNAGFELIRTKEPDDLVTFMRDDEYIDIGIFRLEKRGLFEYYTYQGNLIDKLFLDTLDSIEFLGEEFLIPNSVELFLEKNYGKNWKVPLVDEPALNLGLLNYWYRFKRALLRTKSGKILKYSLKKILGRS